MILLYIFMSEEVLEAGYGGNFTTNAYVFTEKAQISMRTCAG